MAPDQYSPNGSTGRIALTLFNVVVAIVPIGISAFALRVALNAQDLAQKADDRTSRATGSEAECLIVPNCP
jgi:hypothetical protein